MIYGLLAAAGWGTSAVAAAVAVRRAGTYLVVLLSQAVGLGALVLLAIVMRRTLDVITGPVAIGLAGAGLIGLVGYLTFYRSVALGPAGLMSAISSTYGGVAAGLAVGLLGEHLGVSGIAGLLLAICGVTLASARGSAGPGPESTGPESTGPAFSAAAIPLAFGSALAYGVSGFILSYFTRQSGWLLPGVIAHGTSVTALLAALPFATGRIRLSRRRGEPAGRLPERGHSERSPRSWRWMLTWAAAAGLTDAGALLAYSRGSQLGQVAITAATSSVYPVIPLIVGVALLGERLRRRQLTGIALIIAGLVLLGLA